MSIDARLEKLIPTLTAKERAILALRAFKRQIASDSSWRQTMPQSQRAEFNRLIVLMNACNIQLPLLITMIQQQTQRLSLRFMWLDTVVDYGNQVWKLAGLLPKAKHRQAEEVVAKSYPVAQLPWRPQEDEHSWLNWSERMEQGVREDLVELHQQLGAIDVVLDEVAAEFDGEDPLGPVMRGVLEEARQELATLHSVLSAMEPLELKEPDEEALELARIYFENGRRLME